VTQFIDCTSMSFQYDIYGIVTINYTIVHNNSDPEVYNTISAGGQTFRGYITDMYTAPIHKAHGWYETQATLVSTTN